MKVTYPTNHKALVWVGGEYHLALSAYDAVDEITVDYSNEFYSQEDFDEWASHLPEWAKVEKMMK